jgi:hypothetical protein
MYSLNQLKTLVSCGRDPARSLPLRHGFLLIPLILVCFAFSPKMQAAPRPETPDPGSVGGALSTADGDHALFNNSGTANSAFGWFSLVSNTTASFNTAVGAGTLVLNNADSNTAVGTAALLFNKSGTGPQTGTQNTAVGTAALELNSGGGLDSEGSFNDAVGAFALASNTTGFSNNAVGGSALLVNDTGAANTAVGDLTLVSGSGDVFSFNTAVGAFALFASTAGSSNNAIGANALGNDDSVGFNNALGTFALADNVTGSLNVGIGDSAGLGNTSGDGNIYIGAFGVDVPDGESDTIRIGSNPDPTFPAVACFIGGIFGQTVGGTGTGVVVDADGQLGTVVSSRRFKHDIKPMDKASEAILALKPVTFHYNRDIKGTPQFGLIAEDVAEVNPDLVVRDKKGELLSVRYEAVNAMLLNEFLKEHRTVNGLKSTVARQEELIAKQQEGMAVLTAQLKEQAAQIQRVSAQLEVSKLAPQVVENR